MIVCILARKHGDEGVTHLDCGCSHGERWWLTLCKEHGIEYAETHERWRYEHIDHRLTPSIGVAA